MPRISYKKLSLQWYFWTLESLFDDVVCEENLEMMIDLVEEEEEEEIEIQVLLGDYLDNSDSVLVVPFIPCNLLYKHQLGFL